MTDVIHALYHEGLLHKLVYGIVIIYRPLLKSEFAEKMSPEFPKRSTI